MTMEDLWALDDYKGQNFLDVCNMLLAALQERLVVVNKDEFNSLESSYKYYKAIYNGNDGFLKFARPVIKRDVYGKNLNNKNNQFFGASHPFNVLYYFAKAVIENMTMYDYPRCLDGSSVGLRIATVQDLFADYSSLEDYDKFSDYVEAFQSEFPEWFIHLFRRSTRPEERWNFFRDEFKFGHVFSNELILCLKRMLKKCDSFELMTYKKILNNVFEDSSSYGSVTVDEDINVKAQRFWQQTQEAFNLKQDNSVFDVEQIDSIYVTGEHNAGFQISERKMIDIFMHYYDSEFGGQGTSSYTKYSVDLNTYLSSEEIKESLEKFLPHWNEETISKIVAFPYVMFSPIDGRTYSGMGVFDDNFVPGDNFWYPAFPEESSGVSLQNMINDGGTFTSLPLPVFEGPTMPDYSVSTNEYDDGFREVIADGYEHRGFTVKSFKVLAKYPFSFS